MNELMPVNELKEIAKYMGPLFQKKPEDLFALMLIAQAEGKHPAIAAQEYDIINGRPTLKAAAVLSRFQAAGGKIQYVKRTDEEVTAKFTHEACGTLSVTWTMERAAKAGLLGNPTWKKYPCQMLSARVVAEGVRAAYPACLGGFYLPEEVQDFSTPAPAQTAEPRDVTPRPDPAPVARPAALQKPSSAPEAVNEPKHQEEPKAEAEPAPAADPDQDLINRIKTVREWEKANPSPELDKLLTATGKGWATADRSMREQRVTALEQQWGLIVAAKKPTPAESVPEIYTTAEDVAAAFDGVIVEGGEPPLEIF